MKFVSTLSTKFHISICSLAFVSTVCRKWWCKSKFIHRPWAACACCRVCTRLRYLLHRLFASAQLLNIHPAVEAGTYCESPFSLLQEEVCTLQHFKFHACNWKRDRKEYITDWVVGYTLEFPPLLECLKGVTTTALELFLTLNILNALPLS